MVKNKKTGKTFRPLGNFVGMPEGKRITADARIKPLMQVTEQSYRKAARAAENLAGVKIGISTLWRDVQALGLRIDRPDAPILVMHADDTEVKGNDGKPDYASIVIGRGSEKDDWALLDFSVNESWQSIAGKVMEKADISGAYVICDSDREISIAFSGKVKGIQECHVHAVRYVGYSITFLSLKRQRMNSNPFSRRWLSSEKI